MTLSWVCCWFSVEILFEIDKNVVLSSRGGELENLTSLVSGTSRSMFTLERDLKSHVYRIKQGILHLAHIDRISKGKYWIPSIISITQALLYSTIQWLKNGDKCNSKPEVYWKCNVWQTGYAIPVL